MWGPLRFDVGRGPPVMLNSRWPDKLETWFAAQRRDMPWRDNPSLYNVWISEVMLQQTRVTAVIPYFERFIERFPNVQALAKARIDDILMLWEGLGYYSRAKNIHAAARQIVAKSSGLPQSFLEWIELPGIGPYTAAAIASIALGEKVPAVDGNVLRVMSRFLGRRYIVSDAASMNKIREFLKPFMESVNPSVFNQALMETGAMICLPRNPRCDCCALVEDCFAHRMGRIKEFPLKKRGKMPPHHVEVAGVICRKAKLLVCKSYRGKMLHGLWEFPRYQVKNHDKARYGIASLMLRETGLSVGSVSPLITLSHAYSHFSVTVHVFSCQWIAGTLKSGLRASSRWISPSTLNQIPMSRVSRRICSSLKKGSLF